MIAGRTEGRGASPGLRALEAGSVTVEAAGALMALTIFFTMLVSGLGAFGAELALTSLARDAARAASLQPDRTSAERVVRQVLHRADGVAFRLDSDGRFVAVSLHKHLQVFRLPSPLELTARASAWEEAPW